MQDISHIRRSEGGLVKILSVSFESLKYDSCFECMSLSFGVSLIFAVRYLINFSISNGCDLINI